MNKFLPYILCSLGVLFAFQANSQDTTANNSTGKLIEFLSAESYTIKKQDSQDFLILVGHVKVRQAKTLLFGDSIIWHLKTAGKGFTDQQIKEYM
jgi:hypothetical protein